MRAQTVPKLTSIILLGLAVAGSVCLLQAQAIIYEDFNTNDFSSDASLAGQTGSTTWFSPVSWHGQTQIETTSRTNLVPNSAPTGYVSTGSASYPGALTFSSPSTNVITSAKFSASSITSGYIWVSYIARRASNSADADRVGACLSDGTTAVYFGNRRSDFGVGTSAGFLNLDTSTGFAAYTNHLIVAKFNLDNSSVSVWLNPDSLVSEAALGAADVTTTSGLSASDGNIQLVFGENGTPAVNMDALRIAYGADSGAALAAITDPASAHKTASYALPPLAKTALADERRVRLHDPYSEVDWDSYGSFKAGMHMHTLQSDGFNSLAEVVAAYRKAGFSILAITDHDWNYPNFQVEKEKVPENRASPYPADPKPKNFPANTTWPWTDYGAPSPESLGMVGIEANELTFRHHIASYFNDYGVWYERTNYDAPYEGVTDETGKVIWEHDQIQGIADKGGLAVLCHPGSENHHRWWERKSLDWYVEHFQQHDQKTLLGIEVTNNKIDLRKYDVGLWDQLLARFMPERSIWGFGGDDMHRLERTKQSYNIFFLSENTPSNVRSAMERGQFVFVSSNRGMDYTKQAHSPIPKIQRISVNHEAGTIQIDATDWDEIRWITAPATLKPIEDYRTSNQPYALGEVVGSGPQINFRDPLIKNYVRAELTRNEGKYSQIIYTNPFGIEAIISPE